MAAGTTGGGADLGSGRAGARTPQRLSSETEAAPKTTEFLAHLAVVAGILISAALIKGGDTKGTEEFIARQAWLSVAIVTGAYLIRRGLAKSGPSEPYGGGASNEDRFTRDGDDR